MFVHWGLYSLNAKGEWVMYNERIPVKEYEKLADHFNPVDFDAEKWVVLAKNTGMKYIVFTSKHHDGFSMFKTNVDSYNVVDGTPFKRDVVKELAEACEKHGIKLCLYYSHVREWRHPHAQSLEMHAPNRYGNYGNYWDYPDECKKNLQTYIDEFDKPQLRELLTQYGPIGIIWFDTASLIRPDQAQELVDLVKSIQPECLVNSRVGDHSSFDYYSLGDDEVPDFNTGVDFETPMTICDLWGYNTMPGNRYRDVKEMIHQLIDIVSLGGNYLLNVGPDPMGVIPPEAQDRLRGIGKWMAVNSEAVYETKASPFPAKPSWGRITAKKDALYLHIYDWKDTITLKGVKSRVKSVHLLLDPDRKLSWIQEPCGALNHDRLVISLQGEVPDQNASVVKVQFENIVQIETNMIENDLGSIELPACLSALKTYGGEPKAKMNITGVVQNWTSTEDWLQWEFLCEHPGCFEAEVTISSGYHGVWDFGHEIVMECNGCENRFTIEDTGRPTDHYQKRIFKAGKISIGSAGKQSLTIRAIKLASENMQGFTLSLVKLTPS